MPAGTDRHYLFLMRHAAHSEGHLTTQGSDHLREVARRVEEWVEAEWRCEPDRRIRLWYTTTAAPEVQESVDLLALEMSAIMRRLGRSPTERFSDHPEADRPVGDSQQSSQHRQRWMASSLPAAATAGQAPAVVLSAYSPNEQVFALLWQWLTASETGDMKARATEQDAPLLVGNDPLIGWLAARLVGRPVPVARGELICLIRDGKGWQLLWTISEGGPDEAETIRSKIKSKMSTATALGTVLVGLTTYLLQNALQGHPTLLQWLAFAVLATSAALYFASLFLYDSLQMPERFWGTRFESREKGLIRARLRYGKSSVRRPPSSSARLLHASMLRVWVWIFTPATILAGLGIALYALSATPTGASIKFEVQLAHVLIAMGALAVSISAWVAWHRPNLGASD